jgi:hypothetical protein
MFNMVQGCWCLRCLLPAVVVFAGKNSVQRQRMVYKVSQQRFHEHTAA